MGNSLHGVSLLSNVHFTNHVQLGRYAAIDVTETEEDKKEEDGGGLEAMLNVSYTVDGSRCKLEFGRRVGKDGKVYSTWFILHDDICSNGGMHIAIRKDGTNLLEVLPLCFCGLFPDMSLTKTNRTIHAWGSVTESNVQIYGSGSKGGLVVLEWKKKSGDENPYMVTVAHYYATISGSFFGQTRMDIGLSVLVKVQVSNDVGLDFTVEGPMQHPAAALFYMFDEVKRTGIWKRTTCPHCANMQKQRTGMLWQSESEDSDNFPPARLHGPRPSAGSVIANDAAVRGNYNGHLLVKRLFLR